VGARIRQLPITPEVVLAAVHAAGERRAGSTARAEHGPGFRNEPGEAETKGGRP